MKSTLLICLFTAIVGAAAVANCSSTSDSSGTGGASSSSSSSSGSSSSSSSSGGGSSSSSSSSGSGGSSSSNSSSSTGGQGGAASTSSTTSSSGMCVPTNGGIEICDMIDNDCNGQIDDLGLNLNDPKTCGTCSNNCYALPANWDPVTVTCTPSPMPGQVPGTCAGSCAQDYYDIDHNGTCEYFCVKTAPNDTICNNKDDDCNGIADDGVDYCNSTTDCGQCGHTCVVLHGTPACVPSGPPPCSPMSTQCAILSCDCGGPGNCWWDVDKSYATGCEYPCDLTNGGVELCKDGLDNDCNGLIDDGCP